MEHLRQFRLACQTGRLSPSIECDERGARIVEFEVFGDLSSQASYNDVLDFVKELERRRVDRELRDKFAPVLKQMSEHYASTLKSGGLNILGIEYR